MVCWCDRFCPQTSVTSHSARSIFQHPQAPQRPNPHRSQNPARTCRRRVQPGYRRNAQQRREAPSRPHPGAKGLARQVTRGWGRGGASRTATLGKPAVQGVRGSPTARWRIPLWGGPPQSGTRRSGPAQPRAAPGAPWRSTPWRSGSACGSGSHLAGRSARAGHPSR